jgi:hypothetical protein
MPPISLAINQSGLTSIAERLWARCGVEGPEDTERGRI